MYGILEDGEVIAEFVAPMTVRSNRKKFQSDTMSLKRKTSRRPSQRWEIETNLMPLTHTANDLFVNFVTCDTTELMQMIMPQNIGVIRRRTSTSACTATGVYGALTVDVAGHNGLIPKGCFVRFANHSKVYMTRNNLNIGDVELGIYPNLRMDVTGVAMAYLDDVIMDSLYDDDTIIGMSFKDGILMDNGVVKILEKL
jgi:hypothetical protein